ncbi:MAG: hypothetical protein ABFD89_09955 [Bryobacteraceae bacterium]
MTTTTTYNTKVFLSIERPNGQVEEVDVTGRFAAPIHPTIMAKITAATAQAGKGKVIKSYSVTTKGTRELSAVDLVDISYERITKAMNI